MSLFFLSSFKKPQNFILLHTSHATHLSILVVMFAASHQNQHVFNTVRTTSKTTSTIRGGGRRPPTMKIKAAGGAAVMDDTGEVTIRRRPPAGHKEHLGMGSERFTFKMEAVTPEGERIDNEENKPRNILEEIVWYKDYELTLMKEKMPLSLVRGQVKLAPPVLDFKQAIIDQMEKTGQPGLIAEVKKASPSKGVIQPNFDPVKIAKAYEEGGAACLSVLTDEKFFQGGFENLKLIKEAGVTCPLLCKEFIVDAYQIYLARARGADAILLITAVLDNQDLKYFTKIAHSVGMKVLLEVHTYGEMKRVLSGDFEIDLLGINNRDLGTFKVDLNVTVELMATELGKEVKERNIVMVGESGIFTIDDVNVVQNAGCGAILVGESLVKQDTPDVGIKKLFGRPL
jgi:indole-3-glycerol phosphate synthase